MINRLLIALFAAAVLVVALSGCNTWRGAGEDIQSVGSAMAGE